MHQKLEANRQGIHEHGAGRSRPHAALTARAAAGSAARELRRYHSACAGGVGGSEGVDTSGTAGGSGGVGGSEGVDMSGKASGSGGDHGGSDGVRGVGSSVSGSEAPAAFASAAGVTSTISADASAG